jgi:hypothetical protein
MRAGALAGDAAGRAVLLGGNGPTNRPAGGAEAQSRVIRGTSVELMQGEMYNSPPIFTGRGRSATGFKR